MKGECGTSSARGCHTVEIPGKVKYHASSHPRHVAVEGKLVEHTQSL